MTHLIQVQQVIRKYGDGDIEVRAVDGVDLSIDRGEFTAIVGPSGSGKSTLLNLISGLDTPSAGQVLLAGKSIGEMSRSALSDFRRDNIGFIFQSFNLIPVLSAAENVDYILLLQGVDKLERQKRVTTILEKVGLADKANKRPNQLSGGQQQRVAVARAIVSRPKLILADEPTANLDSETGEHLIQMMKELNESEGVTFVFSTHDPKIMNKAKRLVVLNDGKITEDTVN